MLTKRVPEHSLSHNRTPIRGAGILLPVFLALAVSTGTRPAQAIAGPLQERMGVSYGWFYQQYRDETTNPDAPAEMEHELDLARPLGEWIMGNCEWSKVNHVRGTYAWDHVDAWVQRANERGYRIIMALNFTASWARPKEFQEPYVWSFDVDKFAAAPAKYREQEWRKYCNDVAARYSSEPFHVHHYSIGNEMNAQYFYTTNDSSMSYATYLRIAAEEIRSVDSLAFIITGGLWPRAETDMGSATPRINRIMNPAHWLDSLYTANPDIGDSFDAVGYHPYARRESSREGELYGPLYDFSAETDSRPVVSGDRGPHDPRALFLFTENLHEVMRAHGDTLVTRSGKQERKRIWATEYGLPTGAVHVPNWTGDPTFGSSDTNSMYISHRGEEAVQASWIDDYVSKWFEWDFTGPLLYFSLRDRAPNLKYETKFTTREHNDASRYQWYGLFTNVDWRPKPAYFELLKWATNTADFHIGEDPGFRYHEWNADLVSGILADAGLVDTVRVHVHEMDSRQALDFSQLGLGGVSQPASLKCLQIIGAGPQFGDGPATGNDLPRVTLVGGRDLPRGVALVLENLCLESESATAHSLFHSTRDVTLRNCQFVGNIKSR